MHTNDQVCSSGPYNTLEEAPIEGSNKTYCPFKGEITVACNKSIYILKGCYIKFTYTKKKYYICNINMQIRT